MWEQGGVYSTSVLWGHIIQYLLNVGHPVFFKAAAGLCKNLGDTNISSFQFFHSVKPILPVLRSWAENVWRIAGGQGFYYN